ncbi:unnamed protein product [Tilletia controversa]|nr:hypothetical protein CF328_g918 [Tilletia controversa]KAE8262746.1 hypothetical protein A4X03_0g2213 [Tilletia caries]CAD6956373.1 unnamed protein product [Tilletia controversa]
MDQRRNSVPVPQDAGKFHQWLSRVTKRSPAQAQPQSPPLSRRQSQSQCPASGATTPRLPSHVQVLPRHDGLFTPAKDDDDDDPVDAHVPETDEFHDAQSSVTGISAAQRLPPPHLPLPHQHHYNPYHENDTLSALGGAPGRQGESVLSFGSLGPPTELVVSGVLRPGQNHVSSSFNVFGEIEKAQQAPPAHSAAGMMLGEDELHRRELLRYHKAIDGHGDEGMSSLSIGAEGIDNLPPPQPQPNIPTRLTSKQQQQEAQQHVYQNGPEDRTSSRRMSAPVTARATYEFPSRSPTFAAANSSNVHQIGNGHLKEHQNQSSTPPGTMGRSQAKINRSLPVSPNLFPSTSHSTPIIFPTLHSSTAATAAGAGAADPQADRPQSRIRIESWRMQVKAPPKMSPAATAALVISPSVSAPNNATSTTADLPLSNAQQQAEGEQDMDDSHDGPGAVAGSTASVVTVHGGDLSSSQRPPPADEFETLADNYAQKRSRSDSRASAHTSGSAGNGSRTPVMRPMEPIILTNTATRSTSPAPPPLPPKDAWSLSRANSLSARGAQQQQPQPQQQEQRARRPPVLPMSADGAPPKFGSIRTNVSQYTTVTGMSDMTSVSKR